MARRSGDGRGGRGSFAQGRGRRFRSPEEKRRIVEETLASGESVASIARRHGVNAKQVFASRKLYLRGRLLPSWCEAGPDKTRLLPVAVVDEASEVAEEETAAADRAAAGVTDMWRGFTGLSAMVQNTLQQNPLGGHVFIFRGAEAIS